MDTTNTQDEIYEKTKASLWYLAARCDGAASEDGQGFNKMDTNFGKDLANKSVSHRLTYGQLKAAVKMMQKYRGQLGDMLPTNQDFEKAFPAEEETKKTKSAITVTVEGTEFLVTFPFNRQLVDAIKTLKNRRWDGKAWHVPTFLAEELKAIIGDVLPQYHQTKESDLKEARVVEQEVHITFPFDRNIVNAIKGLDQRKWNGDEGRWEVPLQLAIGLLPILKEHGFVVDRQIEDLAMRQLTLTEMSDKSVSDFHIDGLLGTPYPYQNAGVEFLEIANGRAIIADEMGLGKTIQAIAYLQLHPEMRPAVIVVPASLKTNWTREISNWMTTDDEVQILSGRKAAEVELDGTIYIINYDILPYWVETLLGISPKVMIADEAHYCKHGTSKRTKAAKELAEGISNIILLTGTPVTNRPIELYPLLNMVDPNRWGHFMNFAKKYCGAKRGYRGWDFSGATNLEELHEAIKPYVIRRQKKDVLKELPAKRRATVLLNGDINLKEYHRELDAAYEAKGAQNILAAIEAMKQAAVRAKLPAAIQWIEDLLDTDEKLIVFCWHNFVVDALMEHFGDKAVQLTGSNNIDQRQESVDRFQNDDSVRLFVGNIKAAGVGLTLTAASNVAFLELAWTPGDHDQAEDRAHRIGQENSVTSYYLLVSGTIEEDIFSLLEEKRKVVDTVHDGSPRDLNFSIYDNLVEKFFKAADVEL